MNILMVHPHDLFDKSEPWTGRILNIARGLSAKGLTVKICYFPVLLNHRSLKVTVDNIDCIPLDRSPTLFSFISNIRVLTGLGKWADIVHFQKCHYYASLAAVIASYINKKPLHYDWDDWEEKIWFESCGKGLRSRFIGFSFKVLESILPLLSDSLSCASSRLKEIALGFGIKEEFIFDAPVGADLGKFRPGLDCRMIRNKFQIPQGQHIVLYIGQLHGAQYVDLLIRAANIVLHSRNDVRFMVVGEGFLEKGLRKMAQDFGLGNKIIFTGAVSHDEIPFYIAAASVCIAPFRDTLVTRCKSPLKIVEYMASQKAIVASNVGEVRRMLGGLGILTPPGDYQAIAKGINTLLDDDFLREKLGLAARMRAERKFNWSYTAENLLKAYEKISQK